MNAVRLYTPQVLAAAVSLARFPMADELSLRGEARSASCGSTLAIGLALDDEGAVDRIGLSAQACAIGQASAAVFAQGAAGRSGAQIAASAQAIRGWLRDEGDMPDWPGLELLEPARAFPARHGAILLAWDAAVRALAKREG
ncbi:iron-sulfur cluster assembly scaffold protein [Croceicoccus marinus]|jgi:NifU-like protein involved in Fe-S cluster formation|uniref:Iron-sulfur cluster assembly scaffold protein n=1 Tax=Croceicoccus marinus TaxID=450378 RepID=A0A7G6VQG2_9SPHN|nr:iron-sulfur cluster assembly scaffold protein [Croceicoccus marinus]QNE03977.1 iron-sulfur cluster assembly scaffold protein [Croceicoccus marinus]